MIAAVSIGKRGPKNNLIGRLEIHLPSETKWHKNFLLEFGFETSCSVQWGGEGKKFYCITPHVWQLRASGRIADLKVDAIQSSGNDPKACRPIRVTIQLLHFQPWAARTGSVCGSFMHCLVYQYKQQSKATRVSIKTQELFQLCSPYVQHTSSHLINQVEVHLTWCKHGQDKN